MSPLLLLLPTLWLLVATFVLLLCRCAALADKEAHSPLPAHGPQARVHPAGARITRRQAAASERDDGPGVLVHTAQARTRLKGRIGGGARRRGPRCTARS